MTENPQQSSQELTETDAPAPDRAEEHRVDVPQNETPVTADPVTDGGTPSDSGSDAQPSDGGAPTGSDTSQTQDDAPSQE